MRDEETRTLIGEMKALRDTVEIRLLEGPDGEDYRRWLALGEAIGIVQLEYARRARREAKRARL